MYFCNLSSAAVRLIAEISPCICAKTSMTASICESFANTNVLVLVLTLFEIDVINDRVGCHHRGFGLGSIL